MRFREAAACAAMAAFCLTPAAHAALGGTPSYSNDLHPTATATVATQTEAGYSINITTFSDGLVVREYIASGTVFGASWSGATMPSLGELFGSYYTQLQQGAAAYRNANGGLSMVVVDQSTLFAQVGGRAGAFSGRAYLPRALPSGVSADAIQ
ncbi:DUF2844 domain-containing protein [Trinickia terrae]|uniref:DUF2844 domain-containing protein n=1 Tax=Trinickia terrae TaxID=2571161 RepID=A0A4U1I5Q1_9BURK|nr:DUF2844 domain-containing protein [Trinickia terrae]TKC88668.1 DUF2844 domain-containing protein [Trinickia terrae]